MVLRISVSKLREVGGTARPLGIWLWAYIGSACAMMNTADRKNSVIPGSVMLGSVRLGSVRLCIVRLEIERVDWTFIENILSQTSGVVKNIIVQEARTEV